MHVIHVKQVHSVVGLKQRNAVLCPKKDFFPLEPGMISLERCEKMSETLWNSFSDSSKPVRFS